MQSRSSRPQILRLVPFLILVGSFLLPTSGGATSEGVLYLEQDRVEAQAPLRLNPTSASTWLDFFSNGVSQFQIQLSGSPLSLTILQTNPLPEVPLLSLTSSGITVHQPLSAQSGLSVQGSLSLPSSGISGAGAGSGLSADLLDGQDSSSFAAAAHQHAGGDITSGTVAEPRIDSVVARDSEIMPTVFANDGSGSTLDADKIDGKDSAVLFVLDEDEVVTGIPHFDGGTTGTTPPFFVDSSKVVSNLNSDKLDSLDEADFLRATAADSWNPTQGDLTLKFEAATGAASANVLFLNATSGKVGINTDTPLAKLHIESNPDGLDDTKDQLRLSYDSGNYASFSVASAGGLTVNTTASGSGGNLTLAPEGDIHLDPQTNTVLPKHPYAVNLGSLTSKFLSLHAAELWIENLVPHNTLATIGGRILVGQTTQLIADLPSDSQALGYTNLDVKHNTLVANATLGDRVYLESNGHVEFLAITAGPNNITGGYRYTVTRNLDGSGANAWPAGEAVFNTGRTGNGFIDLYSIYGMRSAEDATSGDQRLGPSMVMNVRNSSTYNDWTERTAIGNLNGLYDYGNTNTFGFAAGKNTGSWLSVDEANGVRVMKGNAMLAQWDPNGNINVGSDSGGEGNVRLETGAVRLRAGTTDKVRAESDGDVFVGTNAAVAASTQLAIFNTSNPSWNGEAMAPGDLLVGGNSAGQGNLLWKEATDIFSIRRGTTSHFRFDAGGANTGTLFMGENTGAGGSIYFTLAGPGSGGTGITFNGEALEH